MTGLLSIRDAIAIAYYRGHLAKLSRGLDGELEAMMAIGLPFDEATEFCAREGCRWMPSVHACVDLLKGPLVHFKHQYWIDNTVKPVLFPQAVVAIAAAERASQFLLVAILEVGPYPALRGPVVQTLSKEGESSAVSIPYSGCLERGLADVSSMAAALGMLWCHLGSSSIRLDRWREVFHGLRKPQVVKDLPGYSWNHEQPYWTESRVSRNLRLGLQL